MRKALAAMMLVAWLGGGTIALGQEGGKPSVLFVLTPIEAFGKLAYSAAQEWHSAGFEIDQCSPDEVTWDKIRGFNVLVLQGMGKTENDYELLPYMQRNEQLYQRFLEQGGGIFFDPHCAEAPTPIPPIWSFGDKYGVVPLLEEIHDPPNRRVVGGWRVRLSYTDEIASHPTTEDVTGIWYPIERGKIYPYTMPLVLDDNWQVLIETEDTASSVPYSTYASPIDARARAQGYEGKIPICAAREFPSGGRMIAFGLYPAFCFSDPFAPALEQVSIRQGLEGKPSGLHDFLVQSLRWLAEPSLASGTLGGAPTNQEVLKNPYMLEPERFDRQIDWEGLDFGAPPDSYRGLIGARTVISGGQGTVADYVGAARQAGYDWLVFLEDYKQLTEQKLQQLKQECLAASTDDLQAIPGFFITDEFGGYWAMMGDNASLPADRFVDLTRGCLAAPPGDKELLGLGTVMCNYVISVARTGMVVASFNHNQAQYPYYDFRDYDAVALVTQRGTQVIDKLPSGGFSYLEKRGESLIPLAITLLDSPDEMAAVAESNYNSYARLSSLEQIREEFKKWHMLDNPHFYVSNGPQVEDYSWIGDRDYSQVRTWWNLSAYRWLVRLIASSPAGIKMVEIYDGPGNLFRRFLGHGEERVECLIHLVHNQQKNLVAVVTDMEGKRAITMEAYDRTHLFEEFMCGDRNNQLFYSMQARSDGTGFHTGLGCGNTPNKGPWNGELSAAVFKWDYKLGGTVQGFDGAVHGEPALFFFPNFTGTEAEARKLHGRPQRVLNSADVAIGEVISDGTFPPDLSVTNVWHTLGPVLPLDDMRVTMRTYYFSPKPDAMSMFLREITVSTQRGLKPVEGQRLSLNPMFMDARESAKWQLRLADGSVKQGAVQEDQEPMADLELAAGVYWAYYDSPQGGAAIYPLSEGWTATAAMPQPWRFMVQKAFADQVSPYEQFTFRVVIAGTHMGQRDNAQLFEDFRTGFGIGCEPRYQVEMEQGEILEQELWLKTATEKGAVALTIPQCDLPARLPILVEGVNDRWSVGYLDRVEGKYRPIGAVEGIAYAVTDPSERDQRLFVGHPFTCDQMRAFVTFVPTGEHQGLVEVHNPTLEPMTVTVTRSANFDWLTTEDFTVEAPPGSSVTHPVE